MSKVSVAPWLGRPVVKIGWLTDRPVTVSAAPCRVLLPILLPPTPRSSHMRPVRIRRLAPVLLAAGLLVGPLVPASAQAAQLAQASQVAAPTDFYQPPSPLPAGPPGALIRSQPANVFLGLFAPAATATTVLYHSRTTTGADHAVTGTVLRPRTAWTGPGARPVVSFAVGTQGLAQSCAPSKQLAAGTEYGTSNLALLLARGWAVTVTDYEGYTTGGTPTYVTGRSEAHAVLDIVRAAAQLPGADITPASPLTLWGYSQGGGAAAWATVVQPDYAPELRLLGTAAGGIPADALAVNNNLNANIGAAFLIYGAIGFAQAYPDRFPLYEHLNDAGQAAIAAAKTQCTGQSLVTYAGTDLSRYFKPGTTAASFNAIPSVAQVLRENSLTQTAKEPRVPVWQYHGGFDQILPLAQARALHQQWCADGVPTELHLFPGEHLTSNSQAALFAVNFLAQRFAGASYSAAC